MTDDNEMVFFEEGAHQCLGEGCEQEPFAADGKGEMAAVVFQVDCPEHGLHPEVFHFKCMPPHYKQALEEMQMRDNSRWN